MISQSSVIGIILFLRVKACQGGNCNAFVYLGEGESLTKLTQRCACITDLNTTDKLFEDKVFDFAVNHICKENWEIISSQSSECSHHDFNVTAKKCCDNVWASTQLQLPLSCVASADGVTASGGKSSNIPEYLAGFLIPFLVGITGGIFAYMKGWCCVCIKTIPEKKKKLKRMLSKSTKTLTVDPVSSGDASISTIDGDVESVGVPSSVEVRESSDIKTASPFMIHDTVTSAVSDDSRVM